MAIEQRGTMHYPFWRTDEEDMVPNEGNFWFIRGYNALSACLSVKDSEQRKLTVDMFTHRGRCGTERG